MGEKEEFYVLLRDFKYEEALKMMCDRNEIGQRDLLFEYSYDTGSIDILGFLNFLQNQGWSEECILKWYRYILINALCHIDGAYALAFYYTKKMCKLNPSVDNLEYLFIFHEIPEKLLDDDMALKVAYEILKLDETHEYAQQIVTEIKQKEQVLNILES